MSSLHFSQGNVDREHRGRDPRDAYDKRCVQRSEPDSCERRKLTGKFLRAAFLFLELPSHPVQRCRSPCHRLEPQSDSDLAARNDPGPGKRRRKKEKTPEKCATT